MVDTLVRTGEPPHGNIPHDWPATNKNPSVSEFCLVIKDGVLWTAADTSWQAIEVLKLFTEDLMELVFIMGGQFF